jgi:hypothetical protein
MYKSFLGSSLRVILMIFVCTERKRMVSGALKENLAWAAVLVVLIVAAVAEQDGIVRYTEGNHWFVADAVQNSMWGLFSLQLWWSFPSPVLQANKHRAAAAGLLVSLLMGACALAGYVYRVNPTYYATDTSPSVPYRVARVGYYTCLFLLWITPLALAAARPNAVQPEISNEDAPTAGKPHTKAVAAVSLLFVFVFVANILYAFGYPAALAASYVVLPVVGKSAACVS